MGAKHRMTDLPGRRPRIDPRVQRSASTTILDVAPVSMLCAASLAVLVVSAVASETLRALGMSSSTSDRGPRSR